MSDLDERPKWQHYVAVGLVAGAVIALQIGIMRIFSVGSWAHFGSLVVSLAMLGFGLTSAVMSVATGWFSRHWKGVSTGALLAFGPLTVVANLIAQQVPFNAIFMISDPTQKWRLAANFLLYLTPFLAGAAFLGVVFLKARTTFSRFYFADLAGSGLSGLVFLAAMWVFVPENLVAVPLMLWAAGSVLWFVALGNRAGVVALLVLAIASGLTHFVLPQTLGLTKLAVSDYKGVSYARKFPDSKLVADHASPFGRLEVYSSSYLHFAPGLSDNAAFNLPKMPENAYLGLYVDGDGPIGVIRRLSDEQSAYFRYLPMIYPYLLKEKPETFVVQFGGGISTSLALQVGSTSVTVAEGNPTLLSAFRTDEALRAFTGDVLNDPRVGVIDYDGRLYLAHTDRRFDVIDLSLADSAGLSSPGGFSIVEKFSYTREAFAGYMRALKDGGILSVTLWNKEEPPKSVLKLYATMAAAAGDVDAASRARSFFAVSSYLSTTTVLYKRGGFTEAEIAKLRAHTKAMSFEEIWAPGMVVDRSAADGILADYRNQIFFDMASLAANAPPGGDAPAGEVSTVMPSITLARLAWDGLINGGWERIARDYVFDTRELTNDRAYFAAYVKPGDLTRVTDRLELVQDEWGYLLLWATLGIACITAAVLVLFPVVFGWRTIFSAYPGKGPTILYFACLGLGYIMVEVGLIANFVLALSNATVSASVLITGMLVFSGLGSFVSEKIHAEARRLLPPILVAIGAILIGYGLFLDRVLDLVGAYPYWLRLIFCFVIIMPPAFLMGFPMPTAMGWLARLRKEPMFLWAWGINGCFSVIGAAIVPILATGFGLGAVLFTAGGAYLLAVPAFFAVLLPHAGSQVAGPAGTARH
ncbi:MAG: hypothetical protein ABTQ29_12205 [Siculibacillus sp.]